MRKNHEIRETFGPWALMAPCFAVLLLVGLFPLLYSLYISFQSYHPTNPSFYQGWVFLENYIAAFSDERWLNSLYLTIVFTVSSVLFSLVIGMLLAILFNQDVPGGAVVRTLILIPMLVTPLAVGITWRIIYYPDTGVLNYLFQLVGLPPQEWLSSTNQSMMSVVLVDVWQWTPFMFLILFAGLRSMPRSPVEAAAIDGANAIQTFFYVRLPMMKRVILLAVLLRTIDAARTFDQIFMMTRGGPNLSTDLMSLYLHRVNFKYFDIGYGSALSWLFLVFILTVVIIFIRYTGFLQDQAANR